MSWNQNVELVKAAKQLADKNHPNGYNKSQLIEASKEVNGGFSTSPNKPIKTHEDINNMSNHMANIDGHYPAGMSGCEVVGINGGCGFRCPVFLGGDCKEPGEDLTEELVMESDELDEQEKLDVIKYYL